MKLDFDKKQIEEVIDKLVKRTMDMDLTWDWPCGVAYYGISTAYDCALRYLFTSHMLFPVLLERLLAVIPSTSASFTNSSI